MNTNKELTAFSTQEERHETYFGNEILHQDQVNIRLGKNINHSLLNYKKGFGHVNFKMVKKFLAIMYWNPGVFTQYSLI